MGGQGGKLNGSLKENVSKWTDKKYVKTDKVQYQDAFSNYWSLIQLLNNKKKKTIIYFSSQQQENSNNMEKLTFAGR